MTSIADRESETGQHFPRRRMTRRAQPNRFTLFALALASDALIITIALLWAYLTRNWWFARRNWDVSLPTAAPLIGVGWLAALVVCGAYAREAFDLGSEEIRRVLQASGITAGCVCAVNYLLHHQMSRGFFLNAFAMGIALLVLERVGSLMIRRRSRRDGHLLNPVVLVGAETHIDEVAAVLRRESWLGYSIVGALTPLGYGETPGGVPILGALDDMVESVVESGANTMFVAGGTYLSGDDLREIMWDLEAHHVHLVVAPTVTDIAADRVRVHPAGGLPLVHLDPPRWAHSARGAKRLFDIVFATFLLVLLSPILIYAAIAIRLHDGGPVLYRQRRIGQDEEPFGCWKFRSMVTNADALKADLQESSGNGPMLFKMADDPRITKPGHWMRRYSVDELPQLFNVLTGDMSLVGPRPQVQAEVDLYDRGMRRRLHVRPGMTGLWQVSGRSDLSYEDARRLDLYYVDNWSMVQDLLILGRTVSAVFAARGAY